MKKLKTGHYILLVFILLIGLLIGSNYVNNTNQKNLEQNGIETIATITNIDVNNYKANEMEGRYIENYILTFQFSDKNGKVVTTVKTIEKKDYKKYFEKPLNVNDQIKILYDEANSSNSTFKKLEK
ncbi:hypothetical protein AAON49_02400 [Pseudotenacibaculum sp. MALMAid0570]|uniref:hypothetical protein n=1 Tax=Pseudotenacibaculum sp. MALMAid0570 TaxID=3143938 RepID=UPI0032DE9781